MDKKQTSIEINLKRVRLVMLHNAGDAIANGRYTAAGDHLSNFRSSTSDLALDRLKAIDVELEQAVSDRRKKTHDSIYDEYGRKIVHSSQEIMIKDGSELDINIWYYRARYDAFWKVALELSLIPKE